MESEAFSEVVTAASTLFLILDPLGNIPAFLSVLSGVPKRERTRVTLREMVFALIILLAFLVSGARLLGYLGLSRPSLNMGGGILLLVIALRMVFPPSGGQDEATAEDPYIVPLAVPLIAGPSAIAYVLLLSSSSPERLGLWLLSLLAAWAASTVILVASPAIFSRMGGRALRAITRLMGMLLVLVAVQMALNGLGQYMRETFGIS
jgi:multiple antibiotic resistance protein